MTIRRLITQTLLYSSIIQLTGSCINDDPIDRISIEVPDLIEIRDNENLFTVGDTLWIINTTSRYLPMVEDALYPLDIFETTGAPELEYSARLRKQNEDGFYTSHPFNEENIISQVGEVKQRYSSISVIAFLNEDQNTYESVTGIVLSETGAYTLQIKDLYTYGRTTSFSVSIETNIRNANANGDYEFTVID